MKRTNKTSVSLTDDELGIMDAIAKRLVLSRSDVVRHLLIYHGMCGGDFPLTTKILSLPESKCDYIVSEIRSRAENNDPARPQSFRQWVKETVGKDDVPAIEKGSDKLLADLLKGYESKDS